MRHVISWAFLVSLCGVIAGTAGAQVCLVPSEYGTIQQAVDAVSSGGVVKIASGTYSENIRIEKSLILEAAEGAVATISPANWEQPTVVVEALTPAITVTFRGLTFANAWGERALAVNSAAQVDVEQCAFQGNFVDVQAAASAQIRVSGSTFAGYYDASIRATDSVQLTVTDCAFKATTRTNIIEGRSGSTLTVDQSTFTGLGSEDALAVVIADGNSTLRFTNSVVTDLFHGTGVEIQDAGSVSVESSRFERCARGVEVLNVAQSPADTRLVVNDNQILNCYIGIRLAGRIAGISISRNTIADAGLRAIILCTPTCADAYNAGFHFSGQITGADNVVVRSYRALCPPTNTPFWPQGFFKN